MIACYTPDVCKCREERPGSGVYNEQQGGAPDTVEVGNLTKEDLQTTIIGMSGITQ
jgi:hypothetical protein